MRYLYRFTIDAGGKCAVVQTREHMNEKNPWWMWIGGVFGGIYVLANVELAENFWNGTGSHHYSDRSDNWRHTGRSFRVI